MALGAAFGADLGLDQMPLLGVGLGQQFAQVFQTEGRCHVGGIKQRAQPAVVIGPTVGIHGCSAQVGIQALRYLGHVLAALLQQRAWNLMGAGSLFVPMRPVFQRTDQGAKGMAVRQHKTDLDRVAVAPEAGRLHIQHGWQDEGRDIGGGCLHMYGLCYSAALRDCG